MPPAGQHGDGPGLACGAGGERRHRCPCDRYIHPVDHSRVPPLYATQVSVTVRGIDRHGQSVSMAYQVTAVSLTGGQSYSSDGQGVLTIPAGTYAIGAAILTDGSGGQPASRTLDAQIVRARRSITVTLDARAGRLVDVSLSQPGSRPKWIDSSLCVSAGGGVELARDQGWGTVAPTPLYVVPASDSRISFGFVNDWQDGRRSVLPVRAAHIPSIGTLTGPVCQLRSDKVQGKNVSGYWDLATSPPAIRIQSHWTSSRTPSPLR